MKNNNKDYVFDGLLAALVGGAFGGTPGALIGASSVMAGILGSI